MLLAQKLDQSRGGKFLKNLEMEKLEFEEDKLKDDLSYKVDFYLGKQKLDFKKPMKSKFNRYYFSVTDFSKTIGQTILINNDFIKFGNKTKLDIHNKTYYKNGQTLKLRGDMVKEKGDYYISFNDLCEILNLRTHWDYDKSSIIINKINDKKTEKNNSVKNDEEVKKAYIRFEDFTSGEIYDRATNLEKIRVIADYMKSENNIFHVAWVPRYVNSEKGIDNDLAENEVMKNAHFIFTMDYLINRNAVIGIHGYTHQYGDAPSIIGSEFGEKGYNQEEQIRERVQQAIINATKLNIPYKFWETPHYRTTKEQQAIFEEYFSYLYEPYIGVYNKNIITSKRNGLTKYIPTPLSYVKDKDVQTMLNSMENKGEKDAMSLFYHPSKEFDYIDVQVDDRGNINYLYSEDSILKKIVSYADKKGYRFSSIEENN